jgi:hypothetical protein
VVHSREEASAILAAQRNGDAPRAASD